MFLVNHRGPLAQRNHSLRLAVRPRCPQREKTGEEKVSSKMRPPRRVQPSFPIALSRDAPLRCEGRSYVKASGSADTTPTTLPYPVIASDFSSR